MQKLGSEAMHGLERSLLEHVVSNAQPGNPESATWHRTSWLFSLCVSLRGSLHCAEVIAAMDAFWNKTFQAQGAGRGESPCLSMVARSPGAEKWNVRGQKIEEKVLEKVQLKATAHLRTPPELCSALPLLEFRVIEAGSPHPVRCLEMGTYCSLENRMKTAAMSRDRACMKLSRHGRSQVATAPCE